MYAVARFDAEVVKLLLVHGGACENETLNMTVQRTLRGMDGTSAKYPKLHTLFAKLKLCDD
jgi:hypothetical protein